MSRVNNKALMIIIGVLLISNMLLLVLYMSREPEVKKTGKNNRSTVEFMTKELQLDEAQSTSFAKLWAENNDRNKPLYDSLRSGREQLYQYLKVSPTPDSIILTIAGRIAQFEKQLTLNNFEHFRKLSDLCTAPQQVKLDSLLKRMSNKRASRRN